MTIETAVWRRFPVRGGGRFVIPGLKARAAVSGVVARGPFGTRIAVDPRHPEELSVYLWGTVAPEVEVAFERLLGSGSTAIDVGAGPGVVSAMMGVCCAPGRVFAVEPSAALGERIRRQAELNGVAVEVVSGDPMRLDELLLDRVGAGADLVRVLAGGAEARVLRGARSLLGHARPALVFDWCAETWRAEGETPDAAADLLEELEYELYLAVIRRPPRWSVAPISFSRFEPAAVVALRSGTLPGGNVVAIPAGPAGDAARRRLLGA
jgi:hypothetical protein